ncbi:HAD-IC family P-type ATPase [Amycolatopsis sp. NPDC006131]|uniref:cation-translocating P-type ATPase n=1 Tax=Amycolatopsis sp. NPDC006131 TaxID=3156731 RepID=UPI0033A9AE35
MPADARLWQANPLEADESALTGESVPVSKTAGAVTDGTVVADRTGMLFSGTLVTRGSGRAVVTGTGARTELGGIQRLVDTTATVATPLTRKLGVFSRQLSVGILLVAAAAFALGIVRGTPVAEMFTAAVALAVGAIPEGLPAAVSIVLAIGVVGMSRRRSVVRHLPTVETLGSTTVICTDKTGTLSQNRMTVTAVYAGGRMLGPDAGSSALRECLVAGVLCNDAGLSPSGGFEGDPTETALLAAADNAGLTPGEVRRRWPRTSVVPFDSERRMMITAHGDVGYVKGAAGEVLARCDSELTDDGLRPMDRDAVHRALSGFSARGLRLLAFARLTPAGPLEASGNWTMLGLQALQDPPRPEAIGAIGACHDAGIAVKMITGDHAGTARAIAQQVGFAGSATVLTGRQLDELGDDALDQTVPRTNVFARVSPEQKLRLVRSLQRQGHVVAMTGDGVNDAPALRRADIGVAMGRGGTDAAARRRTWCCWTTTSSRSNRPSRKAARCSTTCASSSPGPCPPTSVRAWLSSSPSCWARCCRSCRCRSCGST